ncbi:MAG: Gfo/Idh/MocA family oxidoreductase [Caldilineaceae bacterium]
MTDKLKLALVGCGAIARYHLDGIHEYAPRIQVTTVIDPDMDRAESYAAETGAAAFPSLAEALQHGDFDAVDIMVPHHLHEELALMAFAAGKHVLLEKPMAPTIDACQRILDAAAQARAQFPGLVFMVAENAQYWPEIVLAKELIDEGAIGEIITARASFSMELPPYFFEDDSAWRFSKAKTGGGIAIDGGSHWLRPLRMWMGEIEEVMGVLGRPLQKMEGESLVRSLIRFESGKVATFEALMAEAVMAPQPWWRINGAKGEIVIEEGLEDGALLLYNAENRNGLRVAEPLGYAKSFGPELRDFAHVVLDGAVPAAGPEQSLGELRTALALYRSAESGQWEKVWE